MTAVPASDSARTDASATTPRSAPSRPAWPVLALAVIAALLGLLFYGEARYRSCIARAAAEFPAVPVSSFSQRATGPLKVSFVNERAAALEHCGRF